MHGARLNWKSPCHWIIFLSEGARRDSATYVRMKKKACTEIGINSFGTDFSAEVTQAELLAKIDELNAGKKNVRRPAFSFLLFITSLFMWSLSFPHIGSIHMNHNMILKISSMQNNKNLYIFFDVIIFNSFLSSPFEPPPLSYIRTMLISFLANKLIIYNKFCTFRSSRERHSSAAASPRPSWWARDLGTYRTAQGTTHRSINLQLISQNCRHCNEIGTLDFFKPTFISVTFFPTVLVSSPSST